MMEKGTFEEIAGVEDKSIQMWLRELEEKDLAVALLGAGDDIREKIYRNMSERAVVSLKESMNQLKDSDGKKIDETQKRLIAIMRKVLS